MLDLRFSVIWQRFGCLFRLIFVVFMCFLAVSFVFSLSFALVLSFSLLICLFCPVSSILRDRRVRLSTLHPPPTSPHRQEAEKDFRSKFAPNVTQRTLALYNGLLSKRFIKQFQFTAYLQNNSQQFSFRHDNRHSHGFTITKTK